MRYSFKLNYSTNILKNQQAICVILRFLLKKAQKRAASSAFKAGNGCCSDCVSGFWNKKSPKGIAFGGKERDLNTYAFLITGTTAPVSRALSAR